MKFIRTYLSFLLVSLCFSPLIAQFEDDDHAFLVLIDLEKKEDIALSYTNKFDKKKFKLEFNLNDTLRGLEEFAYEEDALLGPECFVPEIKLVYRYYTHVISLHCTKAITFKNESPFLATAEILPNHLVITPSVHSYLSRLKQSYFGRKNPNQALMDQIFTDPLRPNPFLGDVDIDIFVKELKGLDEVEIDTIPTSSSPDKVDMWESELLEIEKELEEEEEEDEKPKKQKKKN